MDAVTRLLERGPQPADVEARLTRMRVVARARGEAIPEVRVGRYILEERRGSGAFGVVYSAHDPALDRRVAVKFVERGPNSLGESGRAEAQRLAALAHPNVVAVYEVGECSSLGPYVVMEFVEGVTLREWLGKARGWPDIKHVFVGAGQGLQAAHDAGLIHGDFKPDNVLVDGEGRARVVDFGLARSGGAELEINAGTPAYMAPEQLAGGRVGPAADQYSFSRALQEAVFLGSPDGASEPRVAIPDSARSALERGLATDPEQRFASMSELLAALHPRRRRLKPAVVIGAVGALGILAVGVAVNREPSECLAPAPSPHVERGALEGHIANAEAPEIMASWRALFDRVDASVAELDRAWAESCSAGDEASDPNLVRSRQSCLRRVGDAIDAFVDTLPTYKAHQVDVAIEAQQALPPVMSCEGDASPAEDPDPELSREIAETVARILRLEAQGQGEQALEVSRAALQRVAAAPNSVPAARADEAHGWVLARTGLYDEAEVFLRRAYFNAASHGEDQLCAEITLKLLVLVGSRSRDLDGGLHWAQQARSHIDEIDAALLRARLTLHLASFYRVHGRYAEAEEHAVSALRQMEALKASEVMQTNALSEVAAAARHRGDFEAALSHYADAIARLEAVFGRRHPRLGSLHSDYGVALERSSHVAEAEVQYALALEIERAYPTSARRLGGRLINLGGAVASHDAPRAAELHREAAAVLIKGVGRDHPLVATAYENLARDLAQMGEFEEGLELAYRALTIREETLGPEHPDNFDVLITVASMLTGVERYETAADYWGRSVAIARRSYGPRHYLVGLSEAGLSDALASQGRFGEAVEHAEAALDVLEEHTFATNEQLLARWAYAVAVEGLPQSRSQRAAAREAVVEARRVVGDDASQIQLKRRVDAWLSGGKTPPL